MNQTVCLIICFFVGVLVFYLLKQVCGCKVVEGQCGGLNSAHKNAIIGAKKVNLQNPGSVTSVPYTDHGESWFERNGTSGDCYNCLQAPGYLLDLNQDCGIGGSYTPIAGGRKRGGKPCGACMLKLDVLYGQVKWNL